ncbi:hypothetical protein E2C01_056830 [Portunus trituberculatus]|uniref:Uncharacterized protein n=1 Tax=Portunus trituberculatus TaxID=210409 RepID=A0A5B7GYT3_PORTR|nr:hypothetical protein [Portunus trituberculatus]
MPPLPWHDVIAGLRAPGRSGSHDCDETGAACTELVISTLLLRQPGTNGKAAGGVVVVMVVVEESSECSK